MLQITKPSVGLRKPSVNLQSLFLRPTMHELRNERIGGFPAQPSRQPEAGGTSRAGRATVFDLITGRCERPLWRDSPLVLNGVPTAFVLTVTFNFSVKR
jgi:hypothetical protein